MDQYDLGEELKEFYFEKLDFCGCGRPGDTILFIKNLLNIIDMRRTEKITYHEYQNKKREVFQFADWFEPNLPFTDVQQGIIQFVYHYLDKVGILDHGSGIGGAWLSEDGKKLLALLNQVEDFETIMD